MRFENLTYIILLGREYHYCLNSDVNVKSELYSGQFGLERDKVTKKTQDDYSKHLGHTAWLGRYSSTRWTAQDL